MRKRTATPRTRTRPASVRKKAKTAAKKRRGSPKMTAYASFDLYLADRPPLHRKLITALRRFVAATAPELQESVKWGNGCWLLGKVPISYVYAAEDYVQFGFIRGAQLRDPKQLLHGDGQYVRHVKIHKLADIDEAAFTDLLQQAIGR